MSDQTVPEEQVVDPQSPLPLDHMDIGRQPGTPAQVLPPGDTGLPQALKAQPPDAVDRNLDPADRAADLNGDDRNITTVSMLYEETSWRRGAHATVRLYAE